MSTPGFSIDQLMELAGLSVACGVNDYYLKYLEQKVNKKILIICGPGNNGGDGLVAARHLKHFGYEPTIILPKQGSGQLFINLVKQCKDLAYINMSSIISCWINLD
jgi:NAD(P)H-hydrate epimerase